MIKFKLSLIIVFVFAIQNISFSQTNIDFETGNLTGWTGLIGANMNSNVSFTACSTAVNPPLNGTNLNMIPKSYFSMMTPAGSNDPYGGFTMTSPLGGTDVIRLGNENTNVNEGGDCSTPKNCAGTGPAYCSTICGTPVGSSYIESPAEAVTQTFAVTSANALLTYAWAAVLNDGGHPTGEEPYFEVKIYNQSGVEQTCFTNRVIQKTGVTSAGWTKSATKNCWYGSSPAMDVYYRSWTTVNVLLSNYIGQNVTVRFAVAGCVDGGHFGYAYFDAKTGPATITASNASPCGSQTVTLSAPAGVSGPYSWTGPGIVSGASTATVTVNAAGTYTLSVGSGTCTATMTTTVTYSGGPTVTASAGSPTICSGTGPVVLTAGGATTYSWSANAGGVTTNTSSVNPSTTTVYSVTGTTAGCTGTQTVQVTVTPIPTLTVNSPSICSGQSVVLTANTANTYSWSTSATTNTISVSPASTTTYVVTGDNGNGCTVTKTATVTVNTTPTVSVSGAASICSGNPIVLTGGTATTYTWSANAGSANTSTVSVTPGAGTTTYTLTGANGTCTASAVVTVTVTATPTLSVNSPSICSGQSVVLTANTANTYSWSTTATTNTISVSPTSTTTYVVTGDNGNGCTVTKTATVTVNATPTVSISGAASICSGQTIILTGATATNYTWLPGNQNTGTISITPPSGTTTYTLIGANGTCTASATAFVDVSPTPTVAATGTVICSGQNVIISASGAATFTWSANAGSVNTSTASVNPASTTVYTVTGTAGTCTNVTTATVTVNANPTLSLPSNTYTICSGSSTSISTSGATTYTWSPAGTLNSANGGTVTATPGSTTVYTVTGSSASCNSAPATVTVNVNALPTLTLSPTSTTLCSSTSSTLTASGANTYTWSPAGSLNSSIGSTVTATPNTTTTYTVTGTDINGCNNTSNITITVNPTPTLSISPVPPATCAGQSVILTGGTANTYTWSANAGSANTNTVSVTPGSTTTYTLEGSIGSCTASVVATVTVNPLPVLGTASVSPAPCGQSTGCINNVPVSGGTPNYQYSWNNGTTWSATAQYCGLAAGNYTLEVSDQNNCTATQIINVANLNGPTAPSVAATSTVACLGDSATLSITSPQPNIVYTWTDITGTHTGTTYTISNLNPGGNYNVTITATDTNGCTAGTSTTILVHDVPSTAIAGNTHFCKGLSTVLSASPSGIGYSYQWSQNGTPITGATASTFTATNAGNYGVIITDNSTGCKASSVGNYTVGIDSLPKIDTTNMVISNSNCSFATGTITNVTVTPSAGSTYSWTDASGVVVGTSINLGNVPAGSYCLHVTTNPDNCKDSLCALTVNNSGAPIITMSVSANNLCSGQGSTLSAGGATSYTWSPGGVNTSTITVTPNSTTTYTVTGDSLGCTSQQVITVTVTPTPTLSATSSQTTICSSQTATLTATGAATYTWNTGATTGTTTVSPTGATTYTVVGANGNCLNTTTVSVNVTGTPTLGINSTSFAICAGQTATLTASGATNYTWMPTGQTTGTITDNSNTSTIYTVTGNSLGCIATQTATVTVNATPNVPSVTAPSYTYCQGQTVGSITANGTGNILWSSNPGMNPVINIGATYSPAGLPVGTTVFYLEDSTNAGCKSQGTTTVSITIYPTPSVSSGVPDTAKCGAANGGVSNVIITGGTPGYTYQWLDNTGATVGTSVILSNVGQGTYSVIVTDTNGCVASGSGTVFTVPATAPVLASITPPLTQGQAPLNVTFTNNTVGATSYSWNFGNGITSGLQNPLPVLYNAPGTYTVILNAGNTNCAGSDTAIVIIDAPVNIIIPNIYSPNGDGINDEWFVTCTGIRDLHCDIFNRWGQLVYQLLAINDKWDGVMNNGNTATEGTYYYILNATGFDGKEYKSHGPLTLVK